MDERLTLGSRTRDWYSAWYCVPKKSILIRCCCQGSLTNVVGMVLELKNLHPLARVVLGHKVQASLGQLLDVVRVDLVAMLDELARSQVV